MLLLAGNSSGLTVTLNLLIAVWGLEGNLESSDGRCRLGSRLSLLELASLWVRNGLSRPTESRVCGP